METVSAASAVEITTLAARPARTSGLAVSAKPNTYARVTAAAIEATLPQPRAVAIAIPVTSPIAHPVRQWVVALIASWLSDDACAS
jgi:hypothetical protein